MKSIRMRWLEHTVRVERIRNEKKVLVGNLGRPCCKYEDNIKMHIKVVVTRMWTGCIWMRTGTTGDLPDLK
jgi:hypothetical protein